VFSDLSIANTVYPYELCRPVFEYYNKWALHVPYTCIKEYLYYVTNQVIIINNTCFSNITILRHVAVSSATINRVLNKNTNNIQMFAQNV